MPMHTDTDPAQLDGYQRLLTAVLTCAWRDAHGRNRYLREKALAWLRSDGAAAVCDLLGLPVDRLRRGLPDGGESWIHTVTL